MYNFNLLCSIKEAAFLELDEKIIIETFNNINDSPIYFTKIYTDTASTKTMIYIHGGPHTYARNLYNPFFSEALKKGYTVYCLNYYGSSGFGDIYKNMSKNKWLVTDFFQIKNFIEQLIFKNPTLKISLIGESYGCLLSILILESFANNIYSCILISPIFNLNKFLNNKNNETYNLNFQKSTINSYDKKVKKVLSHLNYNLIIVHGLNDQVIPVSQSYDQLKSIMTDKIFIYGNKDDTHYYLTKNTIFNAMKHIL